MLMATSLLILKKLMELFNCGKLLKWIQVFYLTMLIVTISEHHKKFKKSQIVMHFVEKSAV